MKTGGYAKSRVVLGLGLLSTCAISSWVMHRIGYDSGGWWAVPVVSFLAGLVILLGDWDSWEACSRCQAKLPDGFRPDGTAACPQCGALIRSPAMRTDRVLLLASVVIIGISIVFLRLSCDGQAPSRASGTNKDIAVRELDALNGSRSFRWDSRNLPVHNLVRADKIDVDALRTLVEQSGKGNQTDSKGWTPLHILAACHNSSAEQDNLRQAIELLVQKGADVNARTDMGSTPLHLACKADNDNAAVFLIRNGADVLSQDRFGEIPQAYDFQGKLDDLFSAVRRAKTAREAMVRHRLWVIPADLALRAIGIAVFVYLVRREKEFMQAASRRIARRMLVWLVLPITAVTLISAFYVLSCRGAGNLFIDNKLLTLFFGLPPYPLAVFSVMAVVLSILGLDIISTRQATVVTGGSFGGGVQTTYSRVVEGPRAIKEGFLLLQGTLLACIVLQAVCLFHSFLSLIVIPVS